MKQCPTSNMNKSTMYGYEVSHIVASFVVLAASNVFLNIIGLPVILSWGLGIGALLGLRIVSHGQKNGHLELLAKYIFEPHIFLGHKNRKKSLEDK